MNESLQASRPILFESCRPILVMDEAFSALDQPLKGMVRDAIVRNSRAFGTTVLNVSHDRADILQVSDRILFIHEKKVVEKAPPAALYYEPRGCDVAIFLGHSNIFQIHRDPSNRKVVFLEKDVYRDVNFTPPVPVRIDAWHPLDGAIRRCQMRRFPVESSTSFWNRR